MERHKFNGPNFTYHVLWRKVVGSGPNWHMDQTTAPPFVVNDVGTFSAFEIKVQAVNDKGEGPEPDPVIGYSGEDGKQKIKIFFFILYCSFYVSPTNFCALVPLEAPMDVGVVLVNSTTIKVTWAAVDRQTVRGHLLGYKVLILSSSVVWPNRFSSCPHE